MIIKAPEHVNDLFKHINNIHSLCSRQSEAGDFYRGVREKIFGGGAKSFLLIFFPGVKCFFTVENFHFGRPKTNLSRFEKWKERKKERKKEKKRKKERDQDPILLL